MNILNTNQFASSSINTLPPIKSNAINHSIKRKLFSSNDKENKKHRTIYSYHSNVTASVQNGQETAQILKDHAFTRCQILYLTAQELYNQAVRSDGSIAAVKVSIERAVGQGGQAQTPGHHAAHARMDAGLREDRFEKIAEEISKEKKVTPKKKTLFLSKGVPEKVIDSLPNESGTEEIDKKLSVYWTDKQIIDSKLRILWDLTDEVRQETNLIVDLRMEKAIRPLLEKMYVHCMHGFISPIEVCKQGVELIFKHFEIALKETQDRKSTLEEYQKQAFTCFSIEMDFIQNKPLTALESQTYAEAVSYMSNLKTKLCVKIAEAPQGRLKNNFKHFISKSVKNNCLGLNFSQLEQKHHNLKNETDQKISKFTHLLFATEKELEGTQLPPFEILTQQ